MSAMASQITGVSSVCSTIGSGADQRVNQSSASLAFVGGINRWPVNSPHKRPVTRKMFPFYGVIMSLNPNVRCKLSQKFHACCMDMYAIDPQELFSNERNTTPKIKNILFYYQPLCIILLYRVIYSTTPPKRGSWFRVIILRSYCDIISQKKSWYGISVF